VLTGRRMASPGAGGKGLSMRPLQPRQAGNGATWRPGGDATGLRRSKDGRRTGRRGLGGSGPVRASLLGGDVAMASGRADCSAAACASRRATRARGYGVGCTREPVGDQVARRMRDASARELECAARGPALRNRRPGRGARAMEGEAEGPQRPPVHRDGLQASVRRTPPAGATWSGKLGAGALCARARQ
jgi:hypothetical protein